MNNLVTPVPSRLARELFHQTYLTPSHHPEKELIDGATSILTLLDNLVGLMRIPYLYLEIIRIQKIQKGGESFKDSLELRYQTLSTFANALEIFIWFYEKKWITISKRRGKFFQGISYISRIVLYEHAVRKESVAMIRLYKKTDGGPKIFKTVGYKHLKVSLISHSAFLGWISISFISHYSGVPYPRSFLKLLHGTSVAFGLMAMGYDQESEVNQFFQMIRHYLPDGDIYK